MLLPPPAGATKFLPSGWRICEIGGLEAGGSASGGHGVLVPLDRTAALRRFFAAPQSPPSSAAQAAQLEVRGVRVKLRSAAARIFDISGMRKQADEGRRALSAVEFEYVVTCSGEVSDGIAANTRSDDSYETRGFRLISVEFQLAEPLPLNRRYELKQLSRGGCTHRIEE